MATMASSLFRMMNSFAGERSDFRQASNSTQFIARGIVPENVRPPPPGFAAISSAVMEPVEAKSVFYSGTLPTGKLPPSIRFPHICRRPSMTITAVQIPAIVALLAGVLILIMPRFLNFIVAVYLILVGLHGLGLFRSLHM
jgi:hypothetical protein